MEFKLRSWVSWSFLQNKNHQAVKKINARIYIYIYVVHIISISIASVGAVLDFCHGRAHRFCASIGLLDIPLCFHALPFDNFGNLLLLVGLAL